MAYLIVDDQVFRNYITWQQDDFNDFDVPSSQKPLTAKSLKLMENKRNSRGKAT